MSSRTIRGVLCVIMGFFLIAAWASSAASMPEFRIALTFDDGPRPDILKDLLPLLERYEAKGTFFVVGWAAAKHADTIHDVHRRGHEIENHTYGHDNLKKLVASQGANGVRLNLARTSEIIQKITGRKPHFVRPPFWALNDEITHIITNEGYRVVMLERPDINSLDYEDVDKKRPVDMLTNRVKYLIEYNQKRGKTDFVLVFHELPLTVQALNHLIPYFKDKGYRFVRLDALYP